MLRTLSALSLFALLTPALVSAQPANGIRGSVDGNTYTAPGGFYSINIPVLPELGGTISDTDNVVVFQDDYNVHVSIGAFPQDATQRWELSTRGLKDYLTYFFSNFVMPDFTQMFPGTKIESTAFNPDQLGGAMLAFTLLPNGSMFNQQVSRFRDSDKPLVAKRGNLVFIRHNVVYVISVELAERVIEGDSYHKSTADEDRILRDRLDQLVSSMTFHAPATDK